MPPKRGVPRAPLGLPRICIACGNMFRRPPSQASEFCSRGCRWPRNAQACAQCGATFRVPPSRNRSQKQPVRYCNIACKVIATREMRALPLTQERLKAVLLYDQETGWLTWVSCGKGNIKPGTRAGYVGSKGYRFITVFDEEYAEHRLAWFYMTGQWPKDQIDHKDNDKANNAWINLREANNSQNVMNKPRHRFVAHTPKRPYRGVQLHPCGRYQAWLSGKSIGMFGTAEEARDAYWRAAEERYGDFINRKD